MEATRDLTLKSRALNLILFEKWTEDLQTKIHGQKWRHSFVVEYFEMKYE